MLIPYRQHITQTAGLINYDDNGEGTLLMFDSASDITDPIEVAFQSDPMEGQVIAITTRRAITDLTVSSQFFPITAPITSLPAGGNAMWFYSSEASRWLTHP